MSRFTVRFSDEAADEIRAAARWYRQADPELDRLFRTALQDCVRAIQGNPEAFPVVLDRSRRALMRTFPYGVYYSVLGQTIFVVAVYHSRRDPRKLEDR